MCLLHEWSSISICSAPYTYSNLHIQAKDKKNLSRTFLKLISLTEFYKIWSMVVLFFKRQKLITFIVNSNHVFVLPVAMYDLCFDFPIWMSSVITCRNLDRNVFCTYKICVCVFELWKQPFLQIRWEKSKRWMKVIYQSTIFYRDYSLNLSRRNFLFNQRYRTYNPSNNNLQIVFFKGQYRLRILIKWEESPLLPVWICKCIMFHRFTKIWV